MNAWTACGSEIEWMWIFPLLFFLVMIGMMIMFWRRGLPLCHEMMGHDNQETIRQILDRRYASGELIKEQYDGMKRNLAW